MCPTKRPYMVYHIYAVIPCYIVDLCYGVNPCYVVNICHSSYPYYSIMLLVIVEEAHSAKSYLYWILLQISIWKTITSMINKANLWGISVLRLTLMIELKVVTKTGQWGHRDTGRRWRKEASDHKFRITDSHPDKHCCLTSSSLFTICLQVGWNININDQKCKWEGGRLNRSEWKTDSSFWSQMGWKWIFLAAYHQSYILPCSFCISTDSSATV